MGTRTRWLCLPILITLALTGAATVAAQDEGPSPEALWSFQPDNEAPVNDVTIASGGNLVAAALDEGPAIGADEGEVCAWLLSNDHEDPQSPWASCASPEAGPLDDKSMNTVAVEPRSGTSDAFVAASGNDLVHVWSLSAGEGSDQTAEYPDNQDAPSGDVEDLFFLSENWLLAWHEDELSLLKRVDGTLFQEHEDGRWSPEDGDLAHVTVSGDRDRVFVVSADTGVDAEDLHMYVLEPEEGELILNAHEVQTNRGTDGRVAVDEAGEHAVLGTSDGWLFYYQITEAQSEDDEEPEHPFEFSSNPYSVQVGPVSAIEMGAHGQHFAAGTEDNEVRFFEQTTVEDEGPRATPSGTVDVGSPPSQVAFVDEGHQVYVTADALYAFHSHQFEEDDLDPLWTLDGYSVSAFSDDGQRFVATDTATVDTFRQAYRADVAIEGPSEVDPGQPSTFTVTVTNEGSLFDTYELSTADLPTAWTTSFDPSQLELLPGEEGNTTLTITPDETHEPGDASGTVRATSQASPSQAIAGEGMFTVTVLEVYRAKVSVPSDRVEVQQGQTATVQADVKNAGNTGSTVTLDVDQAEDWPVTIENETGSTAELDLDPGDERIVTVNLEVPQDAAEGSTNDLTLTAEPEQTGEDDVASLTLIVDPTYTAALSGPEDTVEVEPDTEETFTVTVENTGNTDDTYTLIPYSNATNPEHLWRVNLDTTSLDVPTGDSQTVDVTVNVPAGAERGEAADVTIVLRSQFTDEKLDEGTYTLEVPEETDDSPLPLLAPLALGLVALARRRPR